MTASPTTPSLESNRSLSVTPDEVERLVKSRERVKVYGEVFTPAHMVNQMLDLVRPELETGPGFVDKTFFEPAAGDGNFLIAILRRKLTAIEKRYRPVHWSTESLFAVASVYGVELLPDNHEAAKAGMLAEFVAFQRRHGLTCSQRSNLWKSAHFLVNANIVCGNTLTGLDTWGQQIEFSWWRRILNTPGTVQRESFTLASLREARAGMLLFDVSNDNPTYAPCRIDRVHQEARADV